MCIYKWWYTYVYVFWRVPGILAGSLHRYIVFKVKGLKRLNQNNTTPTPQMKIIKKKKNTKKDKETITEKVREWRGVASDNEYLGLLHVIMYVYMYQSYIFLRITYTVYI